MSDDQFEKAQEKLLLKQLINTSMERILKLKEIALRFNDESSLIRSSMLNLAITKITAAKSNKNTVEKSRLLKEITDIIEQLPPFKHENF
jgi:hypothetical protein